MSAAQKHRMRFIDTPLPLVSNSDHFGIFFPVRKACCDSPSWNGPTDSCLGSAPRFESSVLESGEPRVEKSRSSRWVANVLLSPHSRTRLDVVRGLNALFAQRRAEALHWWWKMLMPVQSTQVTPTNFFTSRFGAEPSIKPNNPSARRWWWRLARFKRRTLCFLDSQPPPL
jgi:hypothetical protein